MLDETLAELYEVPVKSLNQAVKRNRERFPDDLVFQLTSDESDHLRSQFVTSSIGLSTVEVCHVKKLAKFLHDRCVM